MLDEVVNTILSIGATRAGATTHSTRRAHAIPVIGALYKGDWCSFEAPDGYTVLSEDDTLVVLQKVVSSNLWMQLKVCRGEDVSSSDYMLQLALKAFTDGFVERLQDGGHIGDCAGATTDMVGGSHGRTVWEVRTYHGHPLPGPGWRPPHGRGWQQ